MCELASTSQPKHSTQLTKSSSDTLKHQNTPAACIYSKKLQNFQASVNN